MSATPEMNLPSNIDAEITILGSILLDADAIDEVSERLQADDFSIDSHKRIFLRMRQLRDSGTAIDIVTLSHELNKHREIESIGGIAYLARLTEGLPMRPVIDDYIRIVKDKSLLRKMMLICSAAISRAADQSETAVEISTEISSQIEVLLDRGSEQSAERAGDFLDRTYGSAQVMMERPSLERGIPTGFEKLDDLTCGMQKGHLVIIGGRPSMGKALSVDCPVKTPSGWKRNGSLGIGDELASIDGKPSIVTGIFPQGERMMFNVAFSDGRSLETDQYHLWTVHYRAWSKPRILTTSQISTMLTRKRYHGRLWIDMPTGDYGEDVALHVHPWLLGALLGNGSFTRRNGSIKFSSADEWTVDTMRSRLPRGCTLVRQSKAKDGFNYRINGRSIIAGLLNGLCILGHRAETKYIPRCYLLASRASRIALMQGLMDTDGNVEKTGSLVYSTSSPRLALDVQELGRSLGAHCSISVRDNPRYRYKGKWLTGKTAYRVYIASPNAHEFVSLPRKRERTLKKRRQVRLTFSSICATDVCQAQCISVSHPSQTYIAGPYVVTHNSALAGVIAEHVALNLESAVAFFPLEAGKGEFLRRAACCRARVPLQAFKKSQMSQRMIEEFEDAYSDLRNARLYIDDLPKGATLSAVRVQATKLKKQNLLDLLIIDQLSFMTLGTDYTVRKNMNREAEVSIIARQLKLLAKELDIPIVLVCHIKREVAKRSDNRPTLADIRESGSIEQDSDEVLFVHRPEYYDREDKSLQGKGEIIIAKQRDGPTDTCDVLFDSSIVRWHDEIDPETLNQTSFSGWTPS